ncbi:MAG: PAS domain-containing sensor histidine kinase [Candidatus Zixiibacteriota bacterium]
MNELFRQYFESMPCYLTVQDRDFRIVEANRRFCQDFGEFDGRYCYQVYKHRPDKCEVCPVERTFLDGESHCSREIVKTLDGREVSVIVNTTPIRNDAGEIISVMEMSTDITEISRLQQQLRDSQERYRLLFEEVPCYISIQDRDLCIIQANRLHREAFGTFYGCKCYKVYKHRDKECYPCIVRQTFGDGQVRVHEEVVTSRDGKPMNVMVTTAPIRNADGEVEAVIEMSTDITQIRQLQSKLSSVGMIISTVSHDLKGLLNGMDGGIYLVNTGLKKNDQERIHSGWEMVLRNVDRIRSSVLDILYYARDREPEWEETVTKEIVNEVYEVMKSKATNHGIEFEKTFESADGRFEADARAIHSMLVNLIDNSFDACRLDRKKDTPRVTVAVKGLPDHVRFEITDNGIGMNRETREKAFTLFFSSKGSGGTGLGLFIANKIAQSHGGKIELESEPGRGSRFTVTIPRRRPEMAKADKGLI